MAYDLYQLEFYQMVLEPGEIVRVKDGKLLSKIYTKDPLQDKICAMEYIYFSRPDSNLDGINVHTTRKLAGKQLYYENSNSKLSCTDPVSMCYKCLFSRI